MKKLFSIFGVLLAFACTFTFLGCDDIADELAGPEQTWCCMPVTYSVGNQDAELYVWMFYSDSDISSGTNPNSYKVDIPAGITMVVTAQTDVSTVISNLTNTTYIIKTFAKNSNTVADESEEDDDDTYTFNGSKAAWSTIYWAKKDLRNSENQQTSVIDQLKYSSRKTYSVLDWETVKDSFSWKKLLIDYLS